MSFVLGNPGSIAEGSLVVINVKSSHCTIFGKLSNAYQDLNGWRAVLAWSAEFADNFLYLRGTSLDYPLEDAYCLTPVIDFQTEIFQNALLQGGSHIIYDSNSVKLGFFPVRLSIGTQYWYVSYSGGGRNSILPAIESNSAIDFERFEACNYFESIDHPYTDEYASEIASAILPFRSQYTPVRLPIDTQYWHIGYRGGLSSILLDVESNSTIDQERFDAINYFPSNNHYIIHDYALAIQNINLKMRSCKLWGRITLDDYYYYSIFPLPIFINLDRESDTVEHFAGTDLLLTVTSNTVWEVSVDVDWLFCGATFGLGNKDMYLEYEANTMEEERIAHITISSVNISPVVFTLHQLGKPDEPAYLIEPEFSDTILGHYAEATYAVTSSDLTINAGDVDNSTTPPSFPDATFDIIINGSVALPNTDLYFYVQDKDENQYYIGTDNTGSGSTKQFQFSGTFDSIGLTPLAGETYSIFITDGSE